MLKQRMPLVLLPAFRKWLLKRLFVILVKSYSVETTQRITESVLLKLFIYVDDKNNKLSPFYKWKIFPLNSL